MVTANPAVRLDAHAHAAAVRTDHHVLTVAEAEIAARLAQHAHDACGAFAPQTQRALGKASNDACSCHED
jgi:hypothetical protein